MDLENISNNELLVSRKEIEILFENKKKELIKIVNELNFIEKHYKDINDELKKRMNV
jgi:hypothetical protein